MSGVAPAPEGITNPPIDELLERTSSKYGLVIFAAKRARQINAYYSQLSEGLLEYVGPLVDTAPQEKPLSIALRDEPHLGDHLRVIGALGHSTIQPVVAASRLDPDLRGRLCEALTGPV